MPKEPYRSSPWPSTRMPPGIPFIIGNEAAERFSYYGMRTILTIFMVKYLWLMGDSAGTPMSDAVAKDKFHTFTGLVYLTPFLGALLADFIFGKYRVIIWLSLVYCLGHAALALMGFVGKAEVWLSLGLWLIIFGSGGIKPCVSAHVGDQFGLDNQHLLTKIFNWFYFSINLGAFVSSLMTPWLLEWYGPHWAFGVPGVLMLIATICFWAGRYKFVHIPAKGVGFIKELFSGEGLKAILKLFIIYIFVAVFWALFDQTGSSWVLQAEDMNRNFLGVEWLSSQIQALNPILILTFIPLFTYLVYPTINRFFTLTPLRKISIGLFLTAVAFAVVSVAQERIDAGGRPSISWQLISYLILTAGEVMVSIVCLEFSYTQAPRSMKSLVMALFLASVTIGNLFTAQVNKIIQVKAPTAIEWKSEPGDTKTLAGFDKEEGTNDDIILHREKEIEFQGKSELTKLVQQLEEAIENNQYEALDPGTGSTLTAATKDPWGNPYQYRLVNRRQCRITSLGPDNTYMTPWDQGAILKINVPDKPKEPGAFARMFSFLRPDIPWIEHRKEELGIPTKAEQAESGPSFDVSYFVGGQTRLEGAPYFWFFTKVMFGAAVLFVLVALVYKPKTYLFEEE